MLSQWPRPRITKVHPGIRTPAETDQAWIPVNDFGGGGVEFYRQEPASASSAWFNVGAPYQALRFILDNNGDVVIQGRISKTPGSGVNETSARYGDRVFQLPAGYAPAEVLKFDGFAIWPADAPTGIDPLLPGSVMWTASKVTNEQPVLSATLNYRFQAGT